MSVYSRQIIIKCIPTEFYRYICKEENFKQLNVSHPGVLEIVEKFIDQEHKPLLRFDEFNDEEELEMKEIRHEKIRKQKGKFSEEEKATKTAKKREQNKTKEKVMWEKLNELNKNCKDLKQHEKEEKKKMSALSI